MNPKTGSSIQITKVVLYSTCRRYKFTSNKAGTVIVNGIESSGMN